MSSALKLFFLSMPLLSAAGMDVYVSPDGDDSNPGTAASPVRTAIGARDRLRARRAAGENDVDFHFSTPISRIQSSAICGQCAVLPGWLRTAMLCLPNGKMCNELFFTPLAINAS